MGNFTNKLTLRESQICELVSHGNSEKQIAYQLHISEKTVSTHTKNIRRKLGAACAVDIARWYILNNLQKFVVTMVFVFIQCASLLEIDFVRRFSTRNAKVANVRCVRTYKN